MVTKYPFLFLPGPVEASRFKAGPAGHSSSGTIFIQFAEGLKRLVLTQFYMIM